MNNIDWQPHELFEVQSKAYNIEVRRFGIEIHQEVNVRSWPIVTTSYRPEDARIRAVVAFYEFAHRDSEKLDRTICPKPSCLSQSLHGFGTRLQQVSFDRRDVRLRNTTHARDICLGKAGLLARTFELLGDIHSQIIARDYMSRGRAASGCGIAANPLRQLSSDCGGTSTPANLARDCLVAPAASGPMIHMRSHSSSTGRWLDILRAARAPSFASFAVADLSFAASDWHTWKVITLTEPQTWGAIGVLAVASVGMVTVLITLVMHSMKGLQTQIGGLQNEMTRGLDGVRGEMTRGFEGVRGEFESVRGEMTRGFESVRGEIESVRGEMTRGFDGVRSELHSETGGLRAEMNARFETLDARFEAVDRRFDAVDAHFGTVDVRFDSLDRDVQSVVARVLRADGA